MRITVAIMFGLLAAQAQAVLLTPSEAEAIGDRVCKPASYGMLDCQTVAPPLPAAQNDPSLQPLPQTEYEGERIPALTVEAPIKPVLDAIPDKLDGNSVKIGWDIGFGTVAQYWEVWDNGVLRLRSRNFTQRPLVKKGEGGGIDIVSIQSGEATIDQLLAGRHALEIRLCNTASNPSSGGAGKQPPACTSMTAQTWVDGQGADALGGTPDAPTLGWLPNVTTGEPIELAWNMWWGVPGRYWQVLDKGKVLLESAAFETSDAHTQSGRVTLAGLTPGAHALSVKLCSALECSQSDPTGVEVILPLAKPATPVLAVQASTVEGWVVNWHLPRFAVASSKAMSWQWLDPVSGKTIGKLHESVRECLAGDARLPNTRVASYCGEGRVARVDVGASIAVRLCQGDACSDSAALMLDDQDAGNQPSVSSTAPSTPTSTSGVTVLR
ncbi:chitinase N-terminal domain-containing protein [Andreprevotia chitinilytica]|uniref:chitinase N-terminal domain-containing protein n=1 Tax=Andreprevotia chitinilytica TaxID=396808 RepID=UPI00054D9B8B|nr:chitinase N-terminal domain-containing protein [Andreprevotia chitinilytica]